MPVSPQKYNGMLGMGCVQTNSPTSSMTARPCSFHASTAQPSARHCMAPGVCGSSRLPPIKAPAKSVPPEILHHQIWPPRSPTACGSLPPRGVNFPWGGPAGNCCSCANCSVPQDWASALRGEPVVPRARTVDRSPQVRKSMPDFMQLAKNAAPAPKNVTPRSAAKRHRVVQSGAIFCPLVSTVLPPGLPSKMQQVVPPSRPATWAFHITHPVELYQW